MHDPITMRLWPFRRLPGRIVAPTLAAEPRPCRAVEPAQLDEPDLELQEFCPSVPEAEARTPRLVLTADDGAGLPVPPGAEASRWLERTHRVRDIRERKRAVLRPVMQFEHGDVPAWD